MKLYITPTSPYARIVRIVILEKGLGDRIEIIEALTRTRDSPYYAINGSGRVPYLLRDDGPGLEDSRLIAGYLDALDGEPSLVPEMDRENWAYGRLEMYARSMLDGISVWLREMRRPANERSPVILDHEAHRAIRLADFWEGEIDAPTMNGPLTLAQIILITGIDVAMFARMGDVTEGRPQLRAWSERMRQRPSIEATRPAR